MGRGFSDAYEAKDGPIIHMPLIMPYEIKGDINGRLGKFLASLAVLMVR